MYEFGIFDDVYEDAKTLVEENGLSLQNIVNITSKIMQIVEEKGSIQKELDEIGKST